MKTPKIKFKPRITRKYIHKGGASTEGKLPEGSSTEAISPKKNSTTYVVFVKENDTGITAETGNILQLNDTTNIETLTKKIKPDTIKVVANFDNELFEVVDDPIANAIANGNASGNLRPSVEANAIANARSSGQDIAIERANESVERNASVKGSASGEGNSSENDNASAAGRPRINSLQLIKKRLSKKKENYNSRAKRSGVNSNQSTSKNIAKGNNQSSTIV